VPFAPLPLSLHVVVFCNKPSSLSVWEFMVIHLLHVTCFWRPSSKHTYHKDYVTLLTLSFSQLPLLPQYTVTQLLTISLECVFPFPVNILQSLSQSSFVIFSGACCDTCLSFLVNAPGKCGSTPVFPQ
jgi:hypothetical protein